MNHQNFFSGQIIQPSELNAIQDAIDLAIAHTLGAFSLGDGPITGLIPSPDGVSLVLPISAGAGVATDANGEKRWVRLVADNTIDLTAHRPVVNPKWVAVCVHHTVVNSYIRKDDSGADVNYLQTESSELVALEGLEGGGKPDIPPDHVVICDILLTWAQAAVHVADLDRSRARPSYGKQGSPAGVAATVADLAGVTTDNVRPYAAEPATMSVRVRPGRIGLSDKSIVTAGGTIALTAASGGNKKIVLVYIADDGSLNSVDGAEVPLAGAAVAPSHIGKYPVVEVLMLDTTTAILPSQMTDVRPFQRAVTPLRNYNEIIAAGGNQDVLLPFAYVPASHALDVYDNGVKLVIGTGYTETDATHVHLIGITGGHTVEFVAPQTGGANPVQMHAATHDADGPDPINYSTLGGLVAPGFECYTDNLQQIQVRPFAALVAGKMRKSAAQITLFAALTNLNPNQFYYLYAAWVGGAMVVEVSADVPDLARLMKSTDATRTYLATVRTASGANPKIREFHRRNRTTQYIYDEADGVDSHSTWPIGASHTGDLLVTTLDLSAGIPPHVVAAGSVGAVRVTAAVRLDGGVAGDSVELKEGVGATGASSVRNVFEAVTGAGKNGLQSFPVFIDSGRTIQVQLSNAAGTVTVFCDSYED